MRALPALLLVSFLLLAGCSTGADPQQPEPTASPSPAMTPLPAAPVTPVSTDTLHLLEYPDATPQAPDAYAVLRLPVSSFNDVLAAGTMTGAVSRKVWSYELTSDLTGLVGSATFWVDVQGTVLNNPNPLAGGCFWQFRIVTGGALDEAQYAPCVVEPTTVPTGVREISFPVDVPALALSAGTVLDFEIYTQDFARTPDATVEVLTATIAHDSRIRLAGLRLPLDAQGLLSATST